jgi:nitric oxide reductase large subunit
VSFRPGLADTIYRPFFRAGVITVLSLGCLWGAINLFLIGRARDFGDVNYSWTLAHGHAMVFGFVGFFIMGFACQALPRFKQTELWNPMLAYAALPLMAGGIGLQTVAHLIAPKAPYLPLGVLAGLLQIVAVASFALVITRTIRKARKPEPARRRLASRAAGRPTASH